METPHFYINYRPGKQPSEPLPIAARSTGYRVAGEEYCSRVKPGEDILELHWCLGGVGEVGIGNEVRQMHPGDVVFFLPGPVRYYKTVEAPFRLRWVTFDGDAFLRIFESFNAEPLPRPVGPCPEEEFLQLEREILDVTPQGERKAAATAFRILLLATGKTERQAVEDERVRKATSIIEEKMTDPTLNVDWLAGQIRMDRSAFSRLFKRHRGLSPSDYIMRTRVQEAARLLRHSSLPIHEIAVKTGYPDQYYFSRLFKKQLGKPPSVFRRESD